MKKQQTKKLQLNRETLILLASPLTLARLRAV